MKKNVTKTTTEYTYNERGYLLKEVQTVEVYEVDVITGADIAKKTITSDKVDTTVTPESPPFVDPKIYKRAKGVPPYRVTFDDDSGSGYMLINENGELTISGDLKLPKNTISDVANEVKAILDRDIKNSKFTYSPNKAF